MAEGSVGKGWTVEFSDEVPPVSASTWNAVDEVKDISNTSSPAPDIDLTHQGSTEREYTSGFGDPGTWDVSCGLVMTQSGTTAESQAAIWALKQSGELRHWKITAPKSVSTSSTAPIWIFTGTVTAATVTTSIEAANSFNFTIRVNTFTSLTPETRGT